MSSVLHNQPADQEAITAVLRFANMDGIKSDAQVERCFKNLIDFRNMPTWISKAGAEKRGFVDYYKDIQSIVCAWLARAALSESGKRVVAAEIAPVVAASVSATVVFKNGRLDYFHEFEGVYAACAYAAALIIDERRGLRRRLQLCRWSKCTHPFILALTPKEGRPAKFCTGHKDKWARETGAARIAIWRAKKAKKAGKPAKRKPQSKPIGRKS